MNKVFAALSLAAVMSLPALAQDQRPDVTIQKNGDSTSIADHTNSQASTAGSSNAANDLTVSPTVKTNVSVNPNGNLSQQGTQYSASGANATGNQLNAAPVTSTSSVAPITVAPVGTSYSTSGGGSANIGDTKTGDSTSSAKTGDNNNAVSSTSKNVATGGSGGNAKGGDGGDATGGNATGGTVSGVKSTSTGGTSKAGAASTSSGGAATGTVTGTQEQGSVTGTQSQGSVNGKQSQSQGSVTAAQKQGSLKSNNAATTGASNSSGTNSSVTNVDGSDRSVTNNTNNTSFKALSQATFTQQINPGFNATGPSTTFVSGCLPKMVKFTRALETTHFGLFSSKRITIAYTDDVKPDETSYDVFQNEDGSTTLIGSQLYVVVSKIGTSTNKGFNGGGNTSTLAGGQLGFGAASATEQLAKDITIVPCNIVRPAPAPAVVPQVVGITRDDLDRNNRAMLIAVANLVASQPNKVEEKVVPAAKPKHKTTHKPRCK